MTKVANPPPRPRGQQPQDAWYLTGRWEWRQGWWGRVIVWVEEERTVAIWRGTMNALAGGTLEEHRRWRRATMDDIQRMPKVPAHP